MSGKTKYTCSCGRVTDDVYWQHPRFFNRKLESPICSECYERGVLVATSREEVLPASEAGKHIINDGRN